ncbi:hypothetical protein LIER_25034 [Lithospermum erythrorhizon]|uniref:Uncharacterized protein n=1 Tax=Lithospermum erythrorhizon TaxID=34254 RepID=A0AAV3R5F7_LITER
MSPKTSRWSDDEYPSHRPSMSRGLITWKDWRLPPPPRQNIWLLQELGSKKLRGHERVMIGKRRRWNTALGKVLGFRRSLRPLSLPSEAIPSEGLISASDEEEDLMGRSG